MVVTPEYNHGYPGALKNALDYFLPQFRRTPVAIYTDSSYVKDGITSWIVSPLRCRPMPVFIVARRMSSSCPSM